MHGIARLFSWLFTLAFSASKNVYEELRPYCPATLLLHTRGDAKMLSLAEFVVWIVGVAVLVFCYFPTSSRPRYCQTDTECADVHTNSPARPVRAKRSAFKATRLTAYTFLIVETDDIYSEHPFIYAKLIPAANTILLLDTGCGGVSNDSNIEVTSLREFIETVGVEDNDGRALNEGGKMRYIVVLSHCHYDHICTCAA